ncbi:hypothetical protein DFH09DRAFT_1328787 [Mycena vulgaris]|nr:hypothetical protein DFH09DRAFT_1328787 [Mycena vulgaris]
MVWLMNLLLLYRCFVIWDYNRYLAALVLYRSFDSYKSLTTATMVSTGVVWLTAASVAWVYYVRMSLFGNHIGFSPPASTLPLRAPLALLLQRPRDVSTGNSAVFSNLDAQMAFLIMSRSFNLLFTTLVCTRLLTARNLCRLQGIAQLLIIKRVS